MSRLIVRPMNRRPSVFVLCCVVSLLTAHAAPTLPSLDGSVDALISFRYDEQSSSPLLATWKASEATRALDADRTERTRMLVDPRTGLELRIVFVTYRDFPTVEWTVFLKNTGMQDTPILSDIRALDFAWTQPAGTKDFLLRHPAGTMFPAAASDYKPLEQALAKGKSEHFAPRLGRPTGDLMPFFNLDFGDSSGVIVALGWPGAWAFDFNRDGAAGVRVMAGQEFTHLRLHPGEEIRTPLVVVQTWQGDWIDA